jgi:hypothetical protein
VSTLITEEMQAIVGRPYARATSFPVSASDIRRWAIAVYYPQAPPREFYDDEYAASTPAGGIVAPLEFNPFAWMAEGEAGAAGVAPIPPDPSLVAAGACEHRLGVQPPPLRRGLNGGLDVSFTGVPMRPGDVITSTAAIVAYDEREGRLGHMLFTTTENRWVNQHDEVVKIERMTLIRY